MSNWDDLSPETKQAVVDEHARRLRRRIERQVGGDDGLAFVLCRGQSTRPPTGPAMATSLYRRFSIWGSTY